MQKSSGEVTRTPQERKTVAAHPLFEFLFCFFKSRKRKGSCRNASDTCGAYGLGPNQGGAKKFSRRRVMASRRSKDAMSSSMKEIVSNGVRVMERCHLTARCPLQRMASVPARAASVSLDEQ